MVLLFTILWGIFLLLMLALSSELLAKGAILLEHKFGSGFVGSVVLGFITMLPELIFVLVAVRSREIDVALGSAVGGNILLFTIGLGAVIILAYWRHNKVIELPFTIKDDLYYLVASSLYLLYASWDGFLDIYEGIVLVLFYVIFVIHQYWEAKRHHVEPEHGEPLPRKKVITTIVLFFVGAIGLVITAEPFVHVIVEVSHETGVPAMFLALVISPFASELPEKINAFILTMNSMVGAEMAIANFVGSKIQANTLLFGSMVFYFATLTGGGSVEVGKNFLQVMLSIISTLAGVWILYDYKLKLKEGYVVFLSYIIIVFAIYANGGV